MTSARQPHLRRMGVAQPRVAMAGSICKPAKGGCLAVRRSRLLQPAVRATRKGGIDMTGPHPPDTARMQARKGQCIRTHSVGCYPP
jgi:4-hydroxy-L-threonine phosphate dehydrogenase PdxA